MEATMINMIWFNTETYGNTPQSNYFKLINKNNKHHTPLLTWQSQRPVAVTRLQQYMDPHQLWHINQISCILHAYVAIFARWKSPMFIRPTIDLRKVYSNSSKSKFLCQYTHKYTIIMPLLISYKYDTRHHTTMLSV